MKLFIASAVLLVASVSNAEFYVGKEYVTSLNGDGARICQLNITRDASKNIVAGDLTIESTTLSALHLKIKGQNMDHDMTINNDDGNEKTYLELVVSEDQKSVHVATAVKLEKYYTLTLGGIKKLNKRTDMVSCGSFEKTAQ